MTTEFVMAATLVEPAEPATMTLEQILEELRDVERWRAIPEQERRDLDSDLRRRRVEHEEHVAQARELWGRRDLPMPSGLEDRPETRQRIAELDVEIERLDGRRDALLAALRRRIDQEEAGIAAERSACDQEERELAARRERLAVLVTALEEFEGMELGRLLASQGRTQQLGERLASRRRTLRAREVRLGRARSALVAAQA